MREQEVQVYMYWIENGTFGQSPARGNIISAEGKYSQMFVLVSQLLPSFCIYLIQSSGFLLDRSHSLEPFLTPSVHSLLRIQSWCSRRI